MMNQPLVSICIPVYNGEQTIERCLRAVLAQKIEDSELLVVDNKSTDRTVELASRLLNGLPNARIVVNDTNIGRIGNWNRCLELARGRYLKFALANDVLLQGSVQRLMDEALQSENIVIVASRHRLIQQMPEQIPEMRNPSHRYRFTSAEALRLVDNGEDPFWACNGMLIRLEPVMAGGIRFREDMPYMADKLFFLQLAMKGETVFLDASSYLFNAGAAGRFHFAGLNAADYFREYQMFLDEVERLLIASGKPSNNRNQRLLGAYIWLLNEERKPISLSQTLEIFDGNRVFQLRALIEKCLSAVRMRGLMRNGREFLRKNAPLAVSSAKLTRRLLPEKQRKVIEITPDVTR